MSDAEDFSDDDGHAGEAEEEIDYSKPTLNVDVGSSLTSHDWADIDNNDLVSRVRGSAGFRIMREIAPWDGALVAPPALLQKKVFEFFYVQRKESDMWKTLAKECFPKEYENASSDKGEKKRLSALWAQAVLDEIKAMREHGKHTMRWITAVVEAQAADLLFMRRESLKLGPASLEAKAARIVWDQCSNRVKDQAFAAMHLWTNKGGAQSGGIARMYKHQHDLLEELDTHFTAIARATADSKKLPLPLHVVLSTPTGSGKTFTALMVHLRLLKTKHPNVILLYSVPTKQVLKRVGQECEAHAAPYWTAARDSSGDGSMHQVRRPYSIRDRARNRKAMRAKAAIGEKMSAGSGTVESQLEYAADIGYKLKDHGAGKPDIIIADLNTTAALLKAAHAAKDTCFYHQNNLLLYFDEPNMGIHLDPNVLGVVSTIQQHMPIAAVLASATLGPWEGLEQWWRGPVPARQITISLEPYDLPMSTLNVYNTDASTVAPVSPLGIFANYAEFQRTMADHRLPCLLLRHLTGRQGNDLLGIKGPGGDWDKVQADVKSLRVAVEPIFKGLSYADFTRLKALWAAGEGGARKVEGIKGALSKEGVTMVGCIDPRKVAFALAGYANREEWTASVHNLNAKLKEGERMMKEQSKQKDKKKKEEEEEAMMGDEEGGQVGLITLRPMLKVTVAEALDSDIDTLVMLSKGIAYACGSGTEPMVKRLYNQALLTVPDSLKGRAPPLNVLVVDYSSIYGTDCPAVDTLLLQEDLGRLLAWEDLQQFLGRLRRDGTAIFYSLRTLRRAALGPGAEEIEDKAEAEYQRSVELAVLGMQDKAPRDVAAEVAALSEVTEAQGRSVADAAAFALTSVLSFVLPPPLKLPEGLPKVHPAELAGTDKELLAALQKQLKANSALLLKLLKKKTDQVAALNKIEALALSASPFVGRTGGVRFLGAAGQTLKLLYDMDIISEEAFLAWSQQRRAAAAMESDSDVRFIEKTKAFIAWLEESESEEEESDEEDEE